MLRTAGLVSFISFFSLALGNPKAPELNTNYGRIPLVFEENRGQASPRVRFLARGAAYSIFITDREATLSLRHAGSEAKVSVRLAGAHPRSAPQAEDLHESYSNYFIGNDPSKWLRGIRHFGRVRVPQSKNGIDIVYKANRQQLEFDLNVPARADTSDLRLHFDGAESLTIDQNGDLVIHTLAGDLREHAPVAWQQVEGQNRPVQVRHSLYGRQDVVFKLGEYDRNFPLVIDPVVSYSTYLGGSSDDLSAGIAVDSSGYAYVTGNTYSADFPATSGTIHGAPDVFIAKLNTDGSALVYATFIGGSGNDQAGSITVDDNGNALITGRTASPDFPIVFGGGSSYVSSQDVFITKVNSSGAIAASRYLSAENSLGTGIAVDSAGNAYVTGVTSSATFPTTAGSLMTVLPNLSIAAFVVKLDSSLNLIYGTYLGGSNHDSSDAIAIDSSGHAYVTGATGSIDFPTTRGAFKTVLKEGTINAYVTELSSEGNGLVYSTYLGGSNSDSAGGIALDAAGNAYVAGIATSPDFPTTSGAYSTSKPSAGFTATGFVAKVNAGGATLGFSTFLGGNNTDGCSAIAVDASGNVFVLGQTYSPNFPTTPGALKTQPSTTGDSWAPDLFLSEFNPAGSSLIYSTYIGTIALDNLGGLALDANRGVYVEGDTQSLNYPTTASSFQPASKEVNDSLSVFVTKIDFSSPTLCNIVLSSNSVSVPGSGGPGSFTFTAAAGCPWELTSDFFITVIGAHSGFGGGTINYSIEPNPSTYATMTGTIRVNGGTLNPGTNIFTVNQGAWSCTEPVFSPPSVSFNAPGGTQNVSVNLPSGCSWNLANQAPWVTLTNSENPSGPGTLTLNTAPNSYSARQGTITIATKSIPVSQAGGTCTLTLDTAGVNVPAQTTESSVGFTTGLTCGWGAYSTVPWLEVYSTSGQGNGSVYYRAAGNPGTVARSGSLLIGDQTFSVTQAAGPGAIPTSYNWTQYTAYGPGLALGDGGPVGSAGVDEPFQMAFDTEGNLYIADSGNLRIRRVDVNGVITTFAGGGGSFSSIGDGGPPTSAYLVVPRGVAVDGSGNVYITEVEGQRIRKVSNNVISTIAGTGTAGFNGDSQQASTAMIFAPDGIVLDSFGNIYFADTGNQRIRKITQAGIISTIGGTGTQGFGGDGGAATAAQLNNPTSLSIDSAGNLYFVDSNNARVRKISTGGIITTVAGNGTYGVSGDGGPATSASLNFDGSGALTVDASGSIYLDGDTVQKVTPDGIIHTISTLNTVSGANGVVADSLGNVFAGAMFAIYELTPAVKAPANAGIFRQGFLWVLDVDGNQKMNIPPDSVFAFGGIPGDIPITGDWNGDGRTKIGIYRSSNGLWILDTNGNGVIDAGDAVFNLHIGTSPGDIPVVGDWNGDGRSKVGYFRQGFLWILDTNGNHTFDQSDQVYAFGGIAGDVPVVGDWTGTGTSKIGIFRQGFLWILDANGNGNIDGPDFIFAYGGIPGDVPVVGDWTGAGITQVGIFRQGFLWALDANGNHQIDGPNVDYIFGYGGIPGDKPVVGKW